MNNQILISLKRIRIYRERLQDDVANGNPVQGMANAAELAAIAKLLWQQFQKESDAANASDGPKSHDQI